MGKLTNGTKKGTREEHRAHATRPTRRGGGGILPTSQERTDCWFHKEKIRNWSPVLKKPNSITYLTTFMEMHSRINKT